VSLIGLLVVLIIACVVIWATQRILAAFSVADPLRTVIYVVIVLVILFWLLAVFGVSPPGLRVR
jgi:hypothetical protein